MPIQHTVVFSLIHDRESVAEADFLDAANSVLSSIDEVTDFTVREQISPKSDMAWQFSMTFADYTAYDRYNRHPAHTAFVSTRWQSEVAAFQEYDFIGRTQARTVGN